MTGERQRVSSGRPRLIIVLPLLVVVPAVVLGLASVGGWGGVVAIAAVLAVSVAALIRYVDEPVRPRK